MRPGLALPPLALVIIGGTALLVLAVGGLAAFLVALVGGVAALALGAPAIAEAALPAIPAQSTALPELDALLEGIDQPMLLVEGRRIASANRAALALLGRHIVGDDVRLAIRHPAAAARFGGTDPVESSAVDLIGLGSAEQRWEMRIGDAGRGRRVVTLTDQTLNDAAERMRVDFVANASHELRTPLASILGYIETLGDEAGEVPAVRARFLKIMFDEARRMQRLIEDLISLSRIEAEKYRPPSERIDLPALVAQLCTEIKASGSARAADLTCAVGEVPVITGDRAQLLQMLHNLVGNAMKYGRAATPVTITLDTAPGGQARIAVADQGEGIAAEHLPRLTQRFYRVDPGRSRSIGGTGLGLAIVKHIVERHRGRLDLVSTPGIGTTVTVTLPVAVMKP